MLRRSCPQYCAICRFSTRVIHQATKFVLYAMMFLWIESLYEILNICFWHFIKRLIDFWYHYDSDDSLNASITRPIVQSSIRPGIFDISARGLSEAPTSSQQTHGTTGRKQSFPKSCNSQDSSQSENVYITNAIPEPLPANGSCSKSGEYICFSILWFLSDRSWMSAWYLQDWM